LQPPPSKIAQIADRLGRNIACSDVIMAKQISQVLGILSVRLVPFAVLTSSGLARTIVK
jgi:hypothetical protein